MTSSRFLVRECPVHYLSDTEVLAGLLGALEPARKLMLLAGSLRGLRKLCLEEIVAVEGIGKVKAKRLVLAMDLSRRFAELLPGERESITNPRKAANLFMEELRYKKKEHFNVLLLGTKNHVISKEEIFVGCLNASIVHPREIFAVALRKSAASVILVHNHPSGDPSPSREDLEVTRRLVDAGNILGIPVRDHIIIGDGCFFSFKEKGLL